MDHERFDWDYENIRHIARHGVTPEEAEHALLGSTSEVDIREENVEVRVSEMGLTASGRILFVAWTTRHEKTRVVTAFEPNAKLKRQYFDSRGRSR